MQAAKAQVFDLWNPKGALFVEIKKQPTFPISLASETFVGGIVSYSWNRKVLIIEYFKFFWLNGARTHCFV
jgi:hypothetical protein